MEMQEKTTLARKKYRHSPRFTAKPLIIGPNTLPVGHARQNKTHNKGPMFRFGHFGRPKSQCAGPDATCADTLQGAGQDQKVKARREKTHDR